MTMLEERYNPRTLAAQLHEPVSLSLVLASPDTPSSLGRQYLSPRSALAETEEKGTLLERIQMLEKRLDEVRSVENSRCLDVSLFLGVFITRGMLISLPWIHSFVSLLNTFDRALWFFCCLHTIYSCSCSWRVDLTSLFVPSVGASRGVETNNSWVRI